MSDKRATMRERRLRFRRSMRDGKAVSPVVATLILILIAVAAAAALYLWLVTWQKGVTGSIGSPGTQPELTIGGSTSVYPFDELAVTQFEQNNTNVVISNNQGGSGAGMIAVCSGAVDLGAASFPVDAATLVSTYGCSPSVESTAAITTVAYDAVDVIVPSANPHGLLSINYDTYALIWEDASVVAGGHPSLLATTEDGATIPSGIPGATGLTGAYPAGSIAWDQIPACVGGATGCAGVTESATVASHAELTAATAGTNTQISQVTLPNNLAATTLYGNVTIPALAPGYTDTGYGALTITPGGTATLSAGFGASFTGAPTFAQIAAGGTFPIKFTGIATGATFGGTLTFGAGAISLALTGGLPASEVDTASSFSTAIGASSVTGSVAFTGVSSYDPLSEVITGIAQGTGGVGGAYSSNTTVNQNYVSSVTTLYLNYSSTFTPTSGQGNLAPKVSIDYTGAGAIVVGGAGASCGTADLCTTTFAWGAGTATESPCGFLVCAGGSGAGTGAGQYRAPITTVARSDPSGTTQSFEARLIDAESKSTFATASQLQGATTGFSGCGSSNFISDCGYVATQTGVGNVAVIGVTAATPDSIAYTSDGQARSAGTVALIPFLGVGQTVNAYASADPTWYGGILPTLGSSGTIALGIHSSMPSPPAADYLTGYLGWRPFDIVSLTPLSGIAQAFITFVTDPYNNQALASEANEVSLYQV